MAIYVDIPRAKKIHFDKSLAQEKEHLERDCEKYFESLPDAWHRRLSEFARRQREQLIEQVDRLLSGVKQEAARRQETQEKNIKSMQYEGQMLQRAIEFQQSKLLINIVNEINQQRSLLRASLEKAKSGE